MVVFGGAFGELDDRRGLVEDLAAAVEHEVVVGRDKGEGDGGALYSIFRYLAVFVPASTRFAKGLAARILLAIQESFDTAKANDRLEYPLPVAEVRPSS